MTREEIKEIDYEWVNDEFPMLNRVEVEALIDKIYDDFESRTCENCKWSNDIVSKCLNEKNGQDLIDDAWIYMQIEEGFTCGKRFERREL